MVSQTIHIEPNLPAGLYLRNPMNSELGRQLVIDAAAMIGAEGLGTFTLLKLARRVGCTEASVYRYFSSKQQLLHYLLNLYWAYLTFSLEYHFKKHKSPKKQLREAIEFISNPDLDEFADKHLFNALEQVALAEGVGVHMRPAITDDISRGHLTYYMEMVSTVSNLISSAYPAYTFPRSLAVTIIDAAIQQQFYRLHQVPFADQSCKENISGFLLSLLPTDKGGQH